MFDARSEWVDVSVDGEQFLVKRREHVSRVRMLELRQTLEVQVTDFLQLRNLRHQDIQDTDVAFQRLMALVQFVPQCTHHRLVQ